MVGGYVAFEHEELNDLYVRPDMQGQCIGNALLDSAKSDSSGVLRLWTSQRNEVARRFYEHRGFCAIRFTEGFENEEQEPGAQDERVRDRQLPTEVE